MIRRTVAIAIVLISISPISEVPILVFTPMGARLFDGSPPTATITTPPFPPLYSPTPTPKPTPILTARGKPPAISATEAILLDDDTDHILDELNGESPVPMASTTKIMTALIAIQVADLNTVVTIHQDAINEVVLHRGSSAQLQSCDQLTPH